MCHDHVVRSTDKDRAIVNVGGIANVTVLRRDATQPYFSLRPPKSTGRKLFNMPWLENKLRQFERPQDVQATLLEFTAASVAAAGHTKLTPTHPHTEIYE